MSNAQIQTIEDMERLFYSQKGIAYLSESNLLNPFITKDAQVTSGVTGVFNAVYGAQAWVQLNMEANTFGALPKFPWNRSGWRAITARGITALAGGVAEGAALPATTKPTFAEISTKPKTVVVNFENSEVQEYLATDGGDDAFAAMADLRAYEAVEHKEEINAELNTQNGALAGNNFESIDRIAASFDELNNCSENDESTPYTTGDLDIFGLDRDGGASQIADAYVNHNSSTVRSLTDSVLQTLVQNTLSNGANPNGQFFQTGYDTWAVINQLYDPQVRYNLIGAASIQPSVNGIKSLEGHNVGTNVATLYGKVVIISKNTVVDTGGISRVYLLDTSNPEGFDIPRLSIKIAKPTQYFEAGINQGTPFAINKLGTEGMYRTMGEAISTFLKTQGKIRDIKA